MKKFLFAYLLLFLMDGFSSCKKCFHCFNSCQLCSRTIGTHVITQTLCLDSFSSQSSYYAAIAADTSVGYTCAATTPTYTYDFCSNQPGESYYPTYFDRGKRATCNEK